jgi:chorismate dehydratase
MAFRIGAVSFLNTLPLIDWFTVAGHDTAKITRALPSELGALLEQKAADVALLPIVEVFRNKSAGFFPSTGIACRGPVDSVKLFARDGISSLERIIADRGSRTSVALLKILLAERHGISPVFVSGEPMPGILPAEREGILVIGDRCFEYEKALNESESGFESATIKAHDLGRMWHDWTGLPFVFAVWAVAKGAPEHLGDEEIARLQAILDSARDFGMANLERLAAALAAEGRLGYGSESTQQAIHHYFSQSLQYRLGEEEMAGMRRFHELCIHHGLAPESRFPTVL